MKPTDATVSFEARTEAETQRLGRWLAELLPDGAVVGLVGTLGAGKTTLVRSLARACGIPPEEVVSPTFVLVGQYVGDRTVYHFDAYRLRDDEEFLELGAEEYFDRGGLALVEWADRVRTALPPDHFEVRVVITGTTSRTFEISCHAPEHQSVLAVLAERIADR
ncbi:MAG: tRNA (adenosine(37)-N6)-threonylcarbamoyltransferase complex ATPase subunit type 1 TsaE [Pirellulales bacterium]